VIEFEEFIAYIYGKDAGGGGAEERTSGGRHDRMAKSSGPADDGSERDWAQCKSVFDAFAGKDCTLEIKEWAKFCKDAHLIGHGFAKTDVDLIWTKVCPKGKRKIDFNSFKDMLRLAASKRGQQNCEIQDIVEKSHGPHIHATKTDAVRFYDDKSTFTGAAAHNTEFEGTNTEAHVGRHDRNMAAAANELHDMEASEDDWGECTRVFEAFAGPGGELDGKEFIKLCADVKLLGGGFTKQDVDVVFSAACRPPNGNGKKFGFDGFKDAVRRIAKKKKEAVSSTQGLIAKSDGPHLTGVTKTDAVRFYDDKSTYTGAAQGNTNLCPDGQVGDHGADRHEKLQAAQKELEEGGDDEGDWTEALKCSAAYGGGNGVDSREFLKMLGDCKLFDGKFKKEHMDTIFVQAAGGAGVRKLDDDAFKKALRLVAKSKGCEVGKVVAAVAAHSSGPELHGTEAEYSRFHDDKSTYTGAHHGK